MSPSRISEDREQPLWRSLVRIHHLDGCWIGVGFLIPSFNGRHLIMTCAHVVAEALGQQTLAFNEKPPESSFSVTFVNCMGNGKRTVRVTRDQTHNGWWPREPDLHNRQRPQDIAVLELVDSCPPEEAKPIHVVGEVPATDTKVLSFGSPNRTVHPDQDDGNWSNGKFNSVNGSFYEVRCTDVRDSDIIKKGCSGSILWSTVAFAGIGMITRADEKKGIAFATPTKELINAWPPLYRSAQPRLSEGGIHPGFYFINRRKEGRVFKTAFDKTYVEDAQIDGSKRPMVCAVAGSFIHSDDFLSKRLAMHPMASQNYDEDSASEFSFVWPGSGTVRERVEELREEFQNRLKASGSSDSDLIAAMNAQGKPTLVFVALTDSIKPEDGNALKEWIGVIDAMGARDIQEMLQVPLCLFLSFQYCNDTQKDSYASEFYNNHLQNVETKNIARPLKLGILENVNVNEISPWFEELENINMMDAFFYEQEIKQKIRNIYVNNNVSSLPMGVLISEIQEKILQ